jgi:hypothetical protein
MATAPTIETPALPRLAERATDETLLNRVVGQTSGLSPPRPQRIQGVPAAQLTDDQLTTIAADEAVPAITRRSAAVELQARGAETTLAAPAAPTMAADAELPGQPSPAVGRPMAQGGTIPALGGVTPGTPELAQQPAPELQQPGALDTTAGAQAVGLPQPLKLAKTATARNMGKTLKQFEAETGIAAEPYTEPLTEAQQAASALGRVMGNTVTFIKSAPGQLPNGFVVPSVNPKDVYLASDADAPVLGVAVHEITHLLPEPIKTKLDAGMRALFNDNYLAEFAARRRIDINNTALLDNEIPAYMAQAISERPDFWQDLRAKMGDGDFAEVARVILDKLNTFLAGTDREYGQDFLDRYVTDVAKARDLLSTAYADAMKAQGLKPTQLKGVQRAERIQTPAGIGQELGADGSDQAPSYGTGREGAVSVVGRHYSTQQRQTLSGGFYGRGLKGAERTRLDESPDPRLRQRVYFYVDQGSGVRPEAGVGGQAHEARLNNIYDPKTRLIEPQANINAFESAVLNAGFDGYIAPFGNNQAAVVLLGPKHKAVPVRALGAVPSAPAPAAAEPTTLRKGLLSREAAEIDTTKIPGARVRMGNLEIPADQREAANAELKRIGSGIQFSERIDGPERQQQGRVGQVDTHVLNVARNERATADRTTVNAEEKAIIRQAAQKMNLPISEVEQMVRDHKAAHPADAGWAQLTLTGVKIDEDTGKGELQYQAIPYAFNAGVNGKALESNTPEYESKVANLAQAMLREVLGVFARAQNGDVAAKNIIAQSGWYKEMRTRLRQEFGGLGDLFADLLGATSPNTPVRTNWDNSVEALRLATTGAFDKLLPQWIAYFDNLDQAETQFRAVFDKMLKAGMTKADIKRSPEFQEQQQQVRAARNFPDELLPVKANGKKFGFNGFNVARAMVDLWRVVKNADPDIGRGGTAPKAINFSGNLIGFRSRATIDVWAARMLQRLAGGLRIPSMAESGVTGEALESGRNTLQFGLGQDVFSRAVKLIRNDPVLSQDPVLSRINDDDLQALVWFIEKEVWTKGNWTSAAGEGGSFEFEADLAGVSDRERVNELRKVADSSVASTKEQRGQAELDIQRLTQELAALPEIAKANANLEANAQRMAADKTAPKAEKLTKLQKEGIRLENAAAQAAKKKAKTGKAYKALESQLAKAKAVLKKPTTEARQNLRTGALQELGKIARTVDRFTVGLSIQKGAEQGVEPTPPTDFAMADLAQKIADAVVAGDPGATVIGLKSIATEGRYGAPERALDLEAITRAGFDPRPLAVATFDAADQANQDAAFVARVLRPNELFDPQMHRPGVEIYFRDMNQAAEAARMMAGIAGIRVGKTTEFGPGYFEIGGYTVIVDGRPTAEAKAGAMGKPVGMRVLYMPEFEARYGLDPRLENATDEQLAGIIEDRADALGDFADAVLRQFDGVSFAGRFNYEVDTRFAGEYQGAIDAYTNRTTDERAGQGGETPWGGRSIRESIAAATGQLPVNANQPGTELPGGDRSETKLSQARPGKPTVQASQRVKATEAVFEGLDGRGLTKARAETALNARPDADQVRFIQDNFLDILVELEDSGRIKINCK